MRVDAAHGSRDLGLSADFVIYDEQDSIDLLRDCLTGTTISPDAAFWQLSQIKSDCPAECLSLAEIPTLDLTGLAEPYRKALRTYHARLIAELKVSKTTLIGWSRKHQFQIQNLKAIELEALREQWLASTTERVNALGEQLRKIESELATREPAALSTPQLYSLARSLRRQIEQATGPLRFTSPVA